MRTVEQCCPILAERLLRQPSKNSVHLTSSEIGEKNRFRKGGVCEIVPVCFDCTCESNLYGKNVILPKIEAIG